jgi:hypothetical protein
MSLGGWRETRSLDFPPDLVFERLLNVLTQNGYDVESSDQKARATVANGVIRSRWIPWATSPARVAASVDTADAGESRVTMESTPAYMPTLYVEKVHQRNVDRLFDLLTDALGPPSSVPVQPKG